MQLPNRLQAYIPPEKLSAYLVSETHAVGSAKAKFFRSLGFDETNTETLGHGLLTIAHHAEVQDIKPLAKVIWGASSPGCRDSRSNSIVDRSASVCFYTSLQEFGILLISLARAHRQRVGWLRPDSVASPAWSTLPVVVSSSGSHYCCAVSGALDSRDRLNT
jgi:hypothetical protein